MARCLVLVLKAVVLHGGRGTRLRPLTHTGPKQLIPIANKPISQFVLEDLRNSGVKEVAIILGDIFPERVKEYYGNGAQFELRISYIYQKEPRGIAHAISLAKDFVGNDKFVAYLGDNILKGGILRFTNKFISNDYDSMILLTKVKNPSKFGVAQFDKNNNLIRLVEKPKIPPSDYVLTGIYFLTPLIFDIISKLKPSRRGELEITDALQKIISKGLNIGFDFVEGWWKDTGTPDDILDVNRLILDEQNTFVKGKIEDMSSTQGRISVDEDSIIRKGSLVRGPCIIGKNTEVKSGVYVGPYTSIGNQVKVLRGEIENSIIMDRCIIDAEVRIIDSIIGPRSQLVSVKKGRPKGSRFILGEMSQLYL